MLFKKDPSKLIFDLSLWLGTLVVEGVEKQRECGDNLQLSGHYLKGAEKRQRVRKKLRGR
jgi:hypothetical protein